MITPAKKEVKEIYKQIYVLKKNNTDGNIPHSKNDYHPECRAGIQEQRRKPTLMPQHLLTHQNPIGRSSSSSRVLAVDHMQLTRKQTGEILRDKIECRNQSKCIDWSAWNQGQWRES